MRPLFLGHALTLLPACQSGETDKAPDRAAGQWKPTGEARHVAVGPVTGGSYEVVVSLIRDKYGRLIETPARLSPRDLAELERFRASWAPERNMNRAQRRAAKSGKGRER
jgi:hypothetical protein